MGDGATILVLLRTIDHDWRHVWRNFWEHHPFRGDSEAPLFPATQYKSPQLKALTKEGIGKVLSKALGEMSELGWFRAPRGAFGSQSLRRGGATFFARVGADPWFL